MITFHPETVTDLPAALDTLAKLNVKAGLAFNPDKPIDPANSK